MIDSTIYTNGRGEVTAQNVNLAMHGIVGATKDQFQIVDKEFKNVDGKIVEVKNEIIKLSESGIGGITFKFPMALFELLEVSSMEEAYLDESVISAVASEFPTLATPLRELMDHNNKMLEKVNEAKENGEMPIIIVDITALYGEIAAALGSEESVLGYDVAAQVYPAIVYKLDYVGLNYLVTMCSIGTVAQFTVIFSNGICSIETFEEATTFYIPRPGDEATDNSYSLLNIDDAVDYPSTFLKSDFRCSYKENGVTKAFGLVPLSFTKSELGKNLLVKLLFGTDIIEGIINTSTGVTTSRLLSRLPKEEVGIIPEGTLTRVNNLSYPYYDPLPAEGGAVVSIGIKSSVNWKLYDHETFLKEGSAGSTTYEYVVSENTSSESYNHNYRLVDASTEAELDTLWIKQDGTGEATVLFEISPNTTIEALPEGETRLIKVEKINIDSVEYTTSSDWIHVSENEGNFDVTIDANETSSSRDGYVQFDGTPLGSGEIITRTLNIHQEYITENPEEATTEEGDTTEE